MTSAILGVIVVLQLVVIAALFKRSQTTGEAQLIKQDIDTLKESLDNMKDGLSDRLNERLDRNQDLMLKNMQRQFANSSKIVGDVTKSLTELKETNKQVVDVTDELKTLQNILQNPKQRGVLGEFFLDSLLQNVLPPERYELQYAFKDGQIVDAAIKLENDRVLPVDSKFSLENYNRLVESKDKAQREKLVKLFKSDLKTRIDETAKYIRPDENTLDHAFMFIPSEAIYYDLLINSVGSRDLIEYAFREKKVIIVSPTTFLAYLQTVLQGLRSLQIEEQAKDIQKRVGQLGRHIESYEEFMLKLGKSLGTSVNHYNSAHKELGKIDKDITKISGGDRRVDPLELDRPSTDND